MILLRRVFILCSICFANPWPALAHSADPPAESRTKPSITGHWKGAIEVPGTKLDIDIDFSAKPDGAFSGNVSIPAQGAKNLVLSEIKVDDSGKISFEIEGVPGMPKFDGKFIADAKKIEGEFTQGGKKYPFALEATAKPAIALGKSLDGFDTFIETAIKAWKVPGLAIAVVKDEETLYARGFGMRDVNNKRPVTPKTAFAIGSCTKAFTTFLLATLVEEGKLDWDKPVRNYLPGFRMQDPVVTDQLTPRDLVCHRSGLPRHDLMWYNSQFTRKDMVDRLAFLEPSEPIRSKFLYNNLMFLTAGYLAEQLTGRSWEDSVRYRVFEPLGMKSSAFHVSEVKKLDDFALPYDEREKVVKEIPFRDISNVGPAGSIHSSVEDMSKWASMLLGGGKLGGKKLVNRAAVAELFNPRMVMGAASSKLEISAPTYALGWMVDTYRGHRRVHHGGNIDGFTAETVLLPDDGLGIVVLCNRDSSALPSLLVRHASDRLLGVSGPDWNAEALAKKEIAETAEKEAKAKKATVKKPGTVPSHRIEEYAGDYVNPGYGLLKISLSEGKLAVKYNAIEAPLEHWHYDVFNALKNPGDPALEDMKFQFQTNVKGSLDSVEAAFEPSVKPIRFTRTVDPKLTDPDYLKKFIGEYELAGLMVKVDLNGNVLTFHPAGQPSSDLVPDPDGEFHLKIASIITVKFNIDADGKVTGAEVNQPNGVFTAEKKK